MRCSICSRKVKTRFAFAEARRATRAARETCCRVSQLDLGLTMDDDGGANDGNTADKMVLTTADNKFTVRTVACFGQCALAPVVEVNHRICGHVSERTLQREIQTIRSGE